MQEEEYYKTYCITCQKLEEERLKKELFQTEANEEDIVHALDREEDVEEILSTACLLVWERQQTPEDSDYSKRE